MCRVIVEEEHRETMVLNSNLRNSKFILQRKLLADKDICVFS